jgi:hypothetical protein
MPNKGLNFTSVTGWVNFEGVSVVTGACVALTLQVLAFEVSLLRIMPVGN